MIKKCRDMIWLKSNNKIDTATLQNLLSLENNSGKVLCKSMWILSFMVAYGNQNQY